MNYYSGNDYRTLRLRIAIFLLAVTRARIGKILELKAECLSTLQEEFLIEIGGQILFIQTQKIRQVIRERKKDIKYLYTIQSKNDFIFTTDLDLNAKTTIRRESLTRSVNKALRFIGKKLNPPRNLSSKSFKKLINKYMTSQLLIVFMAALGIGLGLNPATSGINPGLLKGATWLFRGIISQLLK